MQVFAQTTFDVSLIDTVTNTPIPYANIGLLQTNAGTVSNDQGFFSLLSLQEVGSLNKTQTIKITAIGYEEKSINYSQLKPQDTIYLNPKAYTYASVNIKAKKFGEEIERGKKIKKKNTVYVWVWEDQLGREIGAPIKIKKESYVKSAHFCLHPLTTDSILLRINLYEYQDGKVGKTLLSKDFFAHTKNGDTLLSIELSELGLVIDHDVFLSLETIENINYNQKVELAFRMSEGPNGNVWERLSKLDAFERPSDFDVKIVRIGFYLKVREVE